MSLLCAALGVEWLDIDTQTHTHTHTHTRTHTRTHTPMYLETLRSQAYVVIPG